MPTGCFFFSAALHKDAFAACNVHLAIKGKIFSPKNAGVTMLVSTSSLSGSCNPFAASNNSKGTSASRADFKMLLGISSSEAEQTPAMSQIQADFMTYTHNSAKGRAEWSSLDLKDMSLEQLNVQMESITEQISSLREELALLHGLGETASEAEKEAGSEIKQQIKNLQNDLAKTLKQMRKVSLVSG